LPTAVADVLLLVLLQQEANNTTRTSAIAGSAYEAEITRLSLVKLVAWPPGTSGMSATARKSASEKRYK
jgi:hypothetical protein